MANYQTQACFLVPCTKSQAIGAIHALTRIDIAHTDELDADVISALSKNDDELSLGELIIKHAYLNHPDQDGVNPVEWSFSLESTDDGLIISHADSIQLDEAIALTQAILKAYQINQVVYIQYANTCSENCTDGFGGGAIAVSKDFVRRMDSNEFVHAERNAHETGERYFILKFTETVEGIEFDSNALMVCAANEDPHQKAEYYASTYRDGYQSHDDEDQDEDQEEDSDYSGFDIDVAFKELTPLEYHTMSKFIPTL